MRQVLCSLMLLAVSTSFAWSQDRAAADENTKQINRELDEALRQWNKAYNAKDASGLAGLYFAKADALFQGVRLRSRQAVQNHFAEEFKKEPGTRASTTDVERLVLSPTLVIESGIWAITGGVDSSRTTRGRYSATLQKINEKWLIVHERGWEMPLAEGRSVLRTRDPLSKKAHEFFKAFAADDTKFLNEIFSDDVEVWINDVKVTGKTAYLARAHHIASDLFKKLSFDKLHVHTNYFSPKALAWDDKTIGETHDGPVVWTNAWFELGATGRTTDRKLVIRDHVDLRWEDGKITEMLVYGNPIFMGQEKEALQASRDGGSVTRKDFKTFCEAQLGSWAGEVTSGISDTDIGKEGKKSTHKWEARLSDDGKAMTYTGVGPGTSARGLCFFDAAAKVIRCSGVSSEGVVMQQTFRVAGKNKWNRRTRQTAADGTTKEFRSVITLSDKGNQLTVVIHGKNADGDDTKQTNVWRRVGK